MRLLAFGGVALFGLAGFGLRAAIQVPVTSQVAAFQAVGAKVRARADARNVYVESDGMPDHPLMVGITNWQQQVPILQSYTGANSWQFPLVPKVAANPLSGKNHFFRGAMAIAVDGVPIFNALNNRGEDSNRIGELDQFGGHCGRADDYHYHVAPTYLTKIVGKDRPIAYALDGYPLYGLTEPDGSAPTKLDSFNGHTTAALGYHYHATTTYPYLNGGFHGEVVEREGQVDPQPRARPIRPDGQPLPGAKISQWAATPEGQYALSFQYQNQTYQIRYARQSDGSYRFEYIDPAGKVSTQTYGDR